MYRHSNCTADQHLFYRYTGSPSRPGWKRRQLKCTSTETEIDQTGIQ